MKGKGPHGVRIAGTGSALPERIVTNHDLEKVLDTSHDWIVQRTGIVERRYCDPARESTVTLSRDALVDALRASQVGADDLDLIIVATCTQESNVPPAACRVAGELGLTRTGAFDVNAACSGFVYAMNLADSLMRSGRYEAIGVVGCDVLTNIIDRQERTVSVLMGDAAGAVVLLRDDNPERGCLYQELSADGTRWDALYLPTREDHIREWDCDNPIRLGYLRMQGREVYRFAVKKFQEVIQKALDSTGLEVCQVSQFVCHQSNARIIESSMERFGLPREKVLINIDRIGNTSAGSVGYCLDELWKAGRIREGEIIMMVAFGAGLTWASNVWRV